MVAIQCYPGTTRPCGQFRDSLDCDSMNRSEDNPTDRDGQTPLWWTIAGTTTRAIGHLFGTLCLAVALAYPLVSSQTLQLYLGAWNDPHFSPAWDNVALHFALATAAWALVVAGFRLIRQRIRERSAPDRVVRAKQGSVMVETLIVIVPFLLLTSGLAQLALRNVAGVLADLALYQGTRTAWVWQPEIPLNEGRGDQNVTEDMVERRARLASAAVFAPSAPSSFQLRDNTPHIVSELSGTMFATFGGTAHEGAGANGQADAARTFGDRDAADGENLSFARAFDDSSFQDRAARKLTFAYIAFSEYDINTAGNRIFVSFRYQFNVVFPWFAHIFGGQRRAQGPSGNGVRPGWYVPIERRPQPGAGSFYYLNRQSPL